MLSDIAPLAIHGNGCACRLGVGRCNGHRSRSAGVATFRVLRMEFSWGAELLCKIVPPPPLSGKDKRLGGTNPPLEDAAEPDGPDGWGLRVRAGMRGRCQV